RTALHVLNLGLERGQRVSGLGVNFCLPSQGLHDVIAPFSLESSCFVAIAAVVSPRHGPYSPVVVAVPACHTLAAYSAPLAVASLASCSAIVSTSARRAASSSNR